MFGDQHWHERSLYTQATLEEALGAKFNVVMGYQGGAEQDLAFERGEVVCRSLSIPTFFAREPFTTWRKNIGAYSVTNRAQA